MIRWSFQELGEVDSTQRVVRELGLEGAPEGTVVTAKRQTAGRGRHGRSWASPEGGLYMSLLLRPLSSAALRSLTLATSIAVVRGIGRATGLEASIRWPNDVMTEGKKVAGVIAESSYVGKTLSFVAVGIGVNCNSPVTVEPSGGPATSLVEELGRKVDIAGLREAILEAFASVHENWVKGLDVLGASREVTGTVGKRVTVKTKTGETFTGVASGIEPSGALILGEGAKKRVIPAEDLEWLREA